jgi:hypothetical protein
MATAHGGADGVTVIGGLIISTGLTLLLIRPISAGDRHGS